MTSSKRRRHWRDQIIRKLAEGHEFLASSQELDEVCRHLRLPSRLGIAPFRGGGARNRLDTLARAATARSTPGRVRSHTIPSNLIDAVRVASPPVVSNREAFGMSQVAPVVLVQPDEHGRQHPAQATRRRVWLAVDPS